MGKRKAFTLVVELTAREELAGLRAFERRQVADAMDANLVHEPLVPSRRRKNLGEPPAGFMYDPPLWELKVGEVRVFYTANQASLTVFVLAIRRKPPNMKTDEVLQ